MHGVQFAFWRCKTIDLTEIDFEAIKPYLTKEKKSTIHNILVASEYFKNHIQYTALKSILDKVERMTEEEFAEYIIASDTFLL